MRLDHEESNKANVLRKALSDLGELRSNKDVEKLFWPLLSAKLAGMAPSLTLQALPDKKNLGTEKVANEDIIQKVVDLVENKVKEKHL